MLGTKPSNRKSRWSCIMAVCSGRWSRPYQKWQHRLGFAVYCATRASAGSVSSSSLTYAESVKIKRAQRSDCNLKVTRIAILVDVSTLDAALVVGLSTVDSIVIDERVCQTVISVDSNWYHKAIPLEPIRSVSRLVSFCLIDARWCRTIKNSPGGCPREFFDPLWKSKSGDLPHRQP